jgi:3-isopropylmalate dehydrogenase/3-isopropylmalate/(R)-2-methylmalate dehydratase small subunit
MYEGKAWKFGDDVDTDAIIPARYLTTSDMKALAAHCLEDLRPGFAREISPGDILVAGRNFGMGSSREHAPAAIKAAGISAVIAQSFARIFYRNAFNIGLPALESPEASRAIAQGDRILVEMENGRIRNITRGEVYECQPVPPFMLELVSSGGLMNLLKNGGWR